MAVSLPRQVWLITGASSGLGLATAVAALRAGHRVIACARSPEKAAQNHPQVEALGGTWVALDVTKLEARPVVENAINSVGRIDVLVNNAGCLGMIGPMEDISDDEFQHVMNTNLYGPIRVIRAVLPIMRAQKSGVIIQVSSTSGIVSSPGNSPYCTSKFALEGFSESLAQEVGTFNIRVVLIVAGMFHTDIMKKSSWAPVSKGYSGPLARQPLKWIKVVRAKLADAEAPKAGDPTKFGERVIDIVDNRGIGQGLGNYLRVPLGSDAAQMCKDKAQEMLRDFTALETIAKSTDYGSEVA